MPAQSTRAGSTESRRPSREGPILDRLPYLPHGLRRSSTPRSNVPEPASRLQATIRMYRRRPIELSSTISVLSTQAIRTRLHCSYSELFIDSVTCVAKRCLMAIRYRSPIRRFKRISTLHFRRLVETVVLSSVLWPISRMDRELCFLPSVGRRAGGFIHLARRETRWSADRFQHLG